MTTFKLADCQKSTSVISILMGSYDNYVSPGHGRRTLDPRFKTAHVKVGNLDFYFISNFVFNVLNHYECLLGWVEDPTGERRIRWWWKSGSCGTWRAGIRFLEDGWTSKGIYEDIHKIKIAEKLYQQKTGYINETQVCSQLQVQMDKIDIVNPTWKIWLNEVPEKEKPTPERTRYVNDLKNLSKVKAFGFLKHVIDNENVKEYNQVGTTPRYYDVAAIDGKNINVKDTFFPVMATDRNKKMVNTNLINGLEIWSALIMEPMKDLRKSTAPLYTIDTDMVKDAQVWKFDVPVTVTGNPALKTLTYEIACSKDVLKGVHQQTKHHDPQHTEVFSAWVKQCYLHPAPDEDLVTSFGNNACFAKNLVGVIQKSADYVHQTEAVDPKYKEAERPVYGHTKQQKYLHLALWNEKTSLLVREFKRRLEKSSYYDKGLQDFKDRNIGENEIVDCVKYWLGRGCDEYLAYHEDPETWTRFGHNQSGVDRVTAIKRKINGLGSLKAIDEMFTQLIKHRKVDGTKYSGDPCATRPTSFFPIFLFYVSRFALNKLGDKVPIVEKIRYWVKVNRNEDKITNFIVKDLKEVTAKNYAEVVKTFARYYS